MVVGRRDDGMVFSPYHSSAIVCLLRTRIRYLQEKPIDSMKLAILIIVTLESSPSTTDSGSTAGS